MRFPPPVRRITSPRGAPSTTKVSAGFPPTGLIRRAAGAYSRPPGAAIDDTEGHHARRNRSHLSGGGRGTDRPQRLPERAALRRPGRAARVRVAVGRRAPLHGLHDVSRRAPVPQLLRRPHPAHPARVDGGRPPVARPYARGGAGRGPRPHVQRPLHPRHRARPRARRVRGLRRQPGGQPADLRRGGADDPPGRRARVLRVRREVREAGAPRPPAAAVQVVPRPDLRRRGVARVVRDHGAARHRHPHHPAEAVGGRDQRAERVSHDLPRRERDGGAAADRRRQTYCDENADRAEEFARSTSAPTGARS
jgi:hypothetical protein